MTMPAVRSKWFNWRRWSLFTAAGLSLLVLGSFALVLPLRWFDPVTTAFMLSDDSGRVPVLHEWVEWAELGSAPALAVVAAEDQRFAEHFGFDIDAIRDALGQRKDSGRLRGASTISQQVTKNLFLWRERSYLRKGLEAWLTLVLETSLPKQRILEIYLNIAEFGPGIYGIGAASTYYFATDPSALSDSEAALLAAVLPSPRRLRVDRPSGYVLDRQNWILNQMRRLQRTDWLSTLARNEAA